MAVTSGDSVGPDGETVSVPEMLTVDVMLYVSESVGINVADIVVVSDVVKVGDSVTGSDVEFVMLSDIVTVPSSVNCARSDHVKVSDSVFVSTVAVSSGVSDCETVWVRLSVPHFPSVLLVDTFIVGVGVEVATVIRRTT